MLNSQNNHKYTNISSNIEYQIPNDSRVNNSFYNGDISNPEQIYSNSFLNTLIENNTLLNYLLIPELSLLSNTCKTVKIIVDRYYPLRLKIQYDDIKNFEKKNKDKKDEYLKVYETQIPLSKNEWFNYDIQNAIDTILRLDRNTIAQLRSIKKLTTLNENIYAPFCIIFNFNSKNEQVIKNGWKKVADNIISDSKFFINIANLKYENLEEEDMLSAFSYLNEIECNIDKISRYSYSLLEMNNWCKAVVIYHILVHPYKYRNFEKSIQIGSEMYKYIAFMDDLIYKFYLFKGYLEIKKLIKPKLGEYIFTFDYQQNIYNNTILEDQNQGKVIIDDDKIMSNILSYLSMEENCKFINTSKFGFICFKESLNILCYNLLKKILTFKYNYYNELYPIIPTIYFHNIFSNYFFMLEDIINPTLNYKESAYNMISFLSKEDINDIKNYKGSNELINSICKIFCAIFNLKVEKAFNNDYSIVNLYIKSVILLAVKGKITKLIRYFNIFSLNNNQLKILYEELSNIYSIDKINRIKNINKGFYQLLIWEMYLFEYIKQFNPFLFKNQNNVLNNKEYNNEQINIINNYIDMMNYLKYILNFKFHFDHLFFIKNKISSYDFISIILNVIEEIKNDPNYINVNNLTESFNRKQGNISNAYFQCKNRIENRNKPSLYKRIMEELIILNIEIIYGEENEENYSEANHTSNNELWDESFYVKNFLELNNIHKNIRNFNYYSNNINNSNAYSFKENYSVNYLSPNNINKYRTKINKSNKKNNKNYSYGGKYNTKKIGKIKNFKNSYNLNKIYGTENYYQDDNSEIVNINLYNTNKSYNFKKSMNYYLNNNRQSDDDFFIIPESILVTKILFYLNLDDFPELSHVNKFFYHAMKTHIYIRLFFLEKKKNKIENINNDIITRIENKRNLFYKKNNISPPSLQHACYLFSYFNKNDVYELKSLFKTYKKEYEIILSVLCIFLNIKPKIFINKEGKKVIDFFPPGKNLFYNKDFIKIIQNIDLDSLNYQTFTKIEKIMQNDIFSLDRMNFYYSPSLIHLINLEMGVMEYFRAIRKYCLNFYDYYILEKDEIIFCQKMDEILKIYYKIKNYSFNSCQKYHQKSMDYLKKMDLEQNFNGEILDFSEDSNDNFAQNIVDNNIQYNIINNKNENNNSCIKNDVNNNDNKSNINKESDNLNQNNSNNLNNRNEQ